MERKTYCDELAWIQKSTVEMAEKTVQAVKLAAQALTTGDLSAANQARQLEKEVDELYLKIDERCVTTIATQQPMAGDLRFLVASIRIATEVERIADYANNIAKMVIKKFSLQDMSPLVSLQPTVSLMAEESAMMLSEAMLGYQDNNADLAALVHKRDAMVNRLNRDLFKGLLAIMAQTSSDINETAMDFHVAVCYLERVADRATNVAEWAYYRSTGYRFPDTKK